jgi:hypothetical protein
MSHEGGQLPLALTAVHPAQCQVAGYTFWVLKDYKQRLGQNEGYYGISAICMLGFDSSTKDVGVRRLGCAIALTVRPEVDRPSKAAAENSRLNHPSNQPRRPRCRSSRSPNP